MFLEFWVNEHTKHIVAPVIERDGSLLVSAEDLASAGIKTSPGEIRADGLVDISKLSGIKITISEIEQKLLLNVPTERLIPQAFNLHPDGGPGSPTSGVGFIGQYDAVGTVDQMSNMGQTSLGAVLGGTIFTPHGNLTSNGFTQNTNGSSQNVRLDTSFEFDQQDITRRWIVGDAISGSQSWSRSVRFAGLQIATDFSLRPDLNTMPLPAFFGQTAVPANIDVFVNSARVFETNVEPGPFEINNLPVVTGNGQASVVVRDVLGRETSVLLPFYASNALLREGLTSYDFDIGSLRQEYGEESFDYRDIISSGTYSKGLTNDLTLEAHSEATQHVQLAGGGAVISLGSYGVLHPDIAVSHSEGVGSDGVGALYSLSFENQKKPVGVFGNVSATTGNYNDLASIGGTAPPEFQMQLGANTSLGEHGSLAGSLIGMKESGQAISRIATGSYTLSFGGKYNLGATAFYDYTHRDMVTEVFVSVSIDGLLGTSNVQKARNSQEEQVTLTNPVNPDGGFGYRLSDSAGDSNIQEADATWIGSHGSLDADVAAQNGDAAGRLTASGGVVYMDGSFYTTKHPDGAVALIRTGQPGTDIYQENRQVATANDNGDALLTGLAPFTANRISIDPNSYNFATIVEDTEKTITPARSSGVVVDFTPKPRFPAILSLHFKDESFPPPGAHVTLSSGGEPLIVGYHGQLFIPDMRGPTKGTVEYDNKTCTFDIKVPKQPKNGSIPRINPVYCLTQGDL